MQDEPDSRGDLTPINAEMGLAPEPRLLEQVRSRLRLKH